MNWLVRCFKGLPIGLIGVVMCTALWAQTDARQSGTSFLSPSLKALQADKDRHPAQLWIERGLALWQSKCASCHGEMAQLKKTVASYPKLNRQGRLVNLEDQIAHHAAPASATAPYTGLPDDDLLALSAALHDAAAGEIIRAEAIQPYWDRGKALWNTRMGRINLACAHCHDQRVGTQMRADTISQGHPTGFPIYRMSWQSLGTLERRLRACYSGVQAPLPPVGSSELRELELFLKVRANGMTIETPSIRR